MPLPELPKLSNSLGVTFRDQNLWREALTHRSYLNEHKEALWDHNERLEFLGDAVLELVCTEHLFKLYPDKTEGDLTTYRAALVNTNTLALVGARLGLGDYLLMSRGESKDTGRARQVILANAVEALIGAVYLDQGFEVSREFVVHKILSDLQQTIARELSHDAKSYFQERAQSEESITPTYQLLSETGPDHDKTFTIGLYLGEKLEAQGAGHSKQEAEQAAARTALAARGWSVSGK